MRQQRSNPSGNASPRVRTLITRQPMRTAGVLFFSLLGWGFLAWLFIDMGHPLAQLTMPHSARWSAANLLAIWVMWAVMMGAMMLPAALPMILTFSDLAIRNAERSRGRSFVAGYLSIWLAFSAAATALQWALQAKGWVDPMIVSTSATLTGLLLVIAGLYQFSPLKKVCLSRCRTPLGFLLGEWRAGTGGAFVMGLRHGLLCVGCCWALMALLFAGGVMNLAWVAALSLAVAVEKIAPYGDRLGAALGLGLLVAGSARLLSLA